MLKLNFSNAETARKNLSEEQQQRITKMYSSLAKDINKEIKKAPRVPSDALRKQYLQGLAQQINAELNSMRGEMQQTIESTMLKTANSVVKDNLDFLRSIGMPIEGAFSHVPAETVRTVATGQLYEGNWTLARQLWKHSVHTQRDVNTIVAKGIAANKSAYDIAKDLEKYVDPKAAKDWDWSKVYPGTAKKIDYNAQRLARTMVSHAYQQAFVRTTKDNPFVTKYRWEASNSARVCEICADRDGKLFDKDDLPLDHPNGMCTFTAVMDQSLESIADRLSDWALGKEDTDLDKWTQDLYGKDWVTSIQEKDPYVHMSENEYKSWQEKNSTLSNLYSSFEKEFGVDLSNGILSSREDRYIKDGPYSGMWLSEILDKRVEAISTATRSYGCGYVQNADGSKCINTYWRTGSANGLMYRKSEIEKTSKALDLLIQSSKVDKEVYVDRWAGATSLERMGIHVTGKEGRIGHAFVTSMDPRDIAKQVQENLVGAIIEDKAYMSASMQSDLNVFRGSDIKYSIQVPKGTNAYITDNTSESEVIFGRGTKQEILGAKVIQAEAYDYEGKATTREVVEITVRILPE